MRPVKVVGAGALALAFSFTTSLSAQNVVVSHDEWMTHPSFFNANERQFVQNSLSWFGLAGSGNILLHTPSAFLDNAPVVDFLTGLGYNVTGSSNPGVDFGAYDAVFSEAMTNLNGAGLASYAAGGGNVFYFGGTGVGGAAAEAAYSNPFLNAVGLNFASTYNGIGTVNTSGYSAQGPNGSALFSGVSSVYGNNGNSITEVAAAGWTTQLFTHTNGAGVYAAARGPSVSVPEPGTYLLLLVGMLGLGFVAWRRQEEVLSA